MILEQLKKDIDELIKICLENNINPYDITIEFIFDIMNITLPGKIHKIKIKGHVNNLPESIYPILVSENLIMVYLKER